MVFSRFEQFWLAEYQRQQDQTDLPKQVQAFDLRQLDPQQSPSQQLLTRATTIAKHSGVAASLATWRRHLRLITLCLVLMALVLGSLASQAVLSQPQPLSLLFALILLLLPNAVMLLVWLVTHFKASKPRGIAALGFSVSGWLSRKFSSDERAEGLRQAWLQNVYDQGLLKPFIALTSHGFWFLISLSSWLTLLFYLSFNDYQFHWATTILSAPQLVTIAEQLNSLPSLLLNAQVPLPNETLTDASFANLAGRWLATCVLIYAVLPRALLMIFSWLWLGLRRRQMQLDSSKAGHLAILQLLQKQHQQPKVVDADQGNTSEQLNFSYAPQGKGTRSASLDYEANDKWQTEPPHDYVGVLDSRARKQQFVAELRANPRQQVDVRVAANLTPDRASMALLAAIAQGTTKLSVQLVCSDGSTYLQQWQRLLDSYGVPHVTL